MRARALAEVCVLRQLIAVVDNAGAVPPPTKTEPVECEVERRFLNPEHIQALLRREIDVRLHATDVFRALGRAVEAEAAKFEMDIVSRYLRSLSPSVTHGKRIRDLKHVGDYPETPRKMLMRCCSCGAWSCSEKSIHS